MAVTINNRTGLSVMCLTLENMKRNVIAGILDAQKAGVQCEMPKVIEVDMALNSSGLPCGRQFSECAARIKTTITIP